MAPDNGGILGFGILGKKEPFELEDELVDRMQSMEDALQRLDTVVPKVLRNMKRARDARRREDWRIVENHMEDISATLGHLENTLKAADENGVTARRIAQELRKRDQR